MRSESRRWHRRVIRRGRPTARGLVCSVITRQNRQDEGIDGAGPEYNARGEEKRYDTTLTSLFTSIAELDSYVQPHSLPPTNRSNLPS